MGEPRSLEDRTRCYTCRFARWAYRGVLSWGPINGVCDHPALKAMPMPAPVVIDSCSGSQCGCYEQGGSPPVRSKAELKGGGSHDR